MLPSNRFVVWGLRLGLLALAASAIGACGGSSASDGAGGSKATGGSVGTGGSSGGSGGAQSGGGTSGGGTTSGGGAAGAAGGSGGGAGQACLADKYDGLVWVNYDQFNPIINSTCSGTNHQDIKDVEKLVFLGDSITVGTFPTPANQVYRELVTAKAKALWPNVEVVSCAVDGADTGDLLAGGNQIANCFPAPEQKKTLIVMTMGGNDIKGMASKKLGATEALAQADTVISNMRAAVTWLKDPTNFPTGSFVVFANIYEYTDLTADLSSCPTAQFAGLSGEWIAATATLVKLREGYMKIAVDTQSDMIFLGEDFCGHGYHYQDDKTQCYAPGATLWFDISCIHPNPEGHGHVADLFWNTITE